MSNKTIQTRLSALQKQMQKERVDAWLILSADPHLSEYLPDHWKLREYFSGFTGSAGSLLVLRDKAYLWADSRYWVQAEKELVGTGITLMKLGEANTPSYTALLQEILPEESRVAVLGDTISIEKFVDLFESLAESGIELTTEFDPFSKIMPDRAELPCEPLYLHDPQFVSESASAKIQKIRAVMSHYGTDVHLVSTLDDIAWITNLRGQDVTYNPVFLAFLMITQSSVTLFIDERKITSEVKKYLGEHKITVFPYDVYYEEVMNIPTDKVIMLDEKRNTYATLEALDEEIEIHYLTNPSTLLKAQKSDANIANIEKAMREDGIAMAHFYSAFEARLAQGETLTELDVADLLAEERAKRPHFVDLSFDTIAGFNANGALPHYRATEENHATLEGNGLLLIDSGAQYQNGTTDITRVIPIGTATDAQKRDFTRVLKSLIVMSETVFPENIPMPYLDAIARRPLWENHLDYGHGTGHGVGYFMNVHEGPQVLSFRAPVTAEMSVKKGMITSIEPGLYRENEWGIRIENLVVALPVEKQQETNFGRYFYFKTLTFFPIDTRLIDRSLLEAKEIEWLNRYHKEVYQKLSTGIKDDSVLAWLKERTAEI
ncbi:aminopeptidase P family protein [Ignatzschineria larvae DSM 13226]|uniref:Aminopeptidase P family protein n=1 Tax=Ignatzschineria larvae DSM 13226 TaxID=1111732 RepID=A0ABZ3C284_9GAMM|nr:aminopeptidase P family protein [Ignatzschineria larvae]